MLSEVKLSIRSFCFILFEEDDQILLNKANGHIKIALGSAGHACQYVISKHLDMDVASGLLALTGGGGGGRCQKNLKRVHLRKSNLKSWFWTIYANFWQNMLIFRTDII